MKRLFCVTICVIMLLSMFSPSVQAIYFSQSSTKGLHFSFYNVGQHILSDYNSGKYGDEVYYLASFGTWGGHGDVAVFLKENVATVVLYQWEGRYKERTLSDAEYADFIRIINNNQVDALPDWDTHRIYDGNEYCYLHLTKDLKAFLYMNNPGFIEGQEDEVYTSVISAFWDLIKTGDFEVFYDVDDAKILIENERYKVQSVWKNGDDFRVLIKDEENSTYDKETLNWYAFDGKNIGQQMDEPPGVFLQNAWDDDPGTHMVWEGTTGHSRGFSMEEHLNNYPWQVSWNGYRVRAMRCFNEENWGNGLWLTKAGEAPILIKQALYGHPVVIPGTDWVLCERADNGWAKPRVVVKINLKTFEEIVIDFSQSGWVSPVIYVNEKVLMSGGGERFFYDPSSDTVLPAEGDFIPLSYLKGRFLQETPEAGKYFALGDQYTVGIYDINDYRFTQVAEYSTLIYDNDHMWVDEAEGNIYIVVNGDLISLPFNIKNAGEIDLDSASPWAQKGIATALDKGFVPTEIQDNFTGIITRAEFCRMAILWLEYRLDMSIDAILDDRGVSYNLNAFSDTQDMDIVAAYALGITNGTTAPTKASPGVFSPDGQFTREQAATMIMNACRVAGMDVRDVSQAGFADIETASSWAVEGINYVRNAGIMQGTSTSPLLFSPKTTYTREQSIVTFNNIQ